MDASFVALLAAASDDDTRGSSGETRQGEKQKSLPFPLIADFSLVISFWSLRELALWRLPVHRHLGLDGLGAPHCDYGRDPGPTTIVEIA